MSDSIPLGRMPKKHIPIFAGAFLFAIGPVLFSCRPPANQDGQNMLTKAEKEAGWVLLFNGRNLKGWRGLGLNGIPKGHWVAEAGAIQNVATRDVPKGKDGKPTRHFDLAAIALFEDFELSFEWKVDPGGNSGLKYNVSEEMSQAYAETKNAAIGFEYQILDDTLNLDARVGPHRAAASLYDILPVSGSVLKTVGEYNAARIVLNGNHGEHWLNGVKVLEYELGTPGFAARIAASKFKDIPGFADKRRGHIVLQDHGDPVWFRNIKLREIAPHQGKEMAASRPDTAKLAYGLALMENHDMANDCFMPEGRLWKGLDRIASIPVVVVNGLYNMVCPPITAYTLHQKLPRSRLIIAEASGHWMGEQRIEQALLKAMIDLEKD